MAVDKLVDSTKLDACLDAEADAIRAKTGGSADIPFDFANNKGFADAIAAIQSGGGEEVYFSVYGTPYTENLVFPEISNVKTSFQGCAELKSVSGLATLTTSAPTYQFSENEKLKTVSLPRGRYIYGGAFQNCTALETVELGSIGYPVQTLRNNAFAGVTKSLTITVFVNASTLSEATADSNVGGGAPWSATGATVIFKSSVTGEALT